MSDLEKNESGHSPHLHIVEIVDSLESGGAQTLLGMRARFAAQMGYRIDVITLGDGRQTAAALEKNGVKIYSYPSPHVLKVDRVIAICRLLRQLQPDVIQTHLRSANIVGSLCGAVARIPVLGTLHGSHPDIEFRNPRREWAEKWGLKLLASKIVAVGPRVARSQQNRFGRKKVFTVANPVELPVAPREICASEKLQRRRDLALPIEVGNDPIILMVGRLIGNKGFPEAFMVLQKLQERMPQVRMLVAGDGDLHDELQRWIDDRALSSSIVLLGRSERVSELMLVCDVLLVASEREGLPLVVLEAMAHQLPVVATAVGDIPWLLEQGRCGTLVKWNDVEGTARSVYGVLADNTLSARKADRALKRVAEDFSVQRWLNEMDELYSSLANRAPCRFTEITAYSPEKASRAG